MKKSILVKMKEGNQVEMTTLINVEDDFPAEITKNNQETKLSPEVQNLLDAFKSSDKRKISAQLNRIIKNSQFDFFKEFLDNFDPNVNSDVSLLHILVEFRKTYSNDKDKKENCFELIKIALKYELSLNKPDKNNTTPFYLILLSQTEENDDLVNYIFENKYEVDLHNFRSADMLEMFRNNNPNRQIPAKIEIDHFDKLKSFIHNNEFKNFKDYFEIFKKSERSIQNGNSGGQNSSFEDSERSIQNGNSDENKSSFDKKLSKLLKSAITLGNAEITEFLIEKEADINGLNEKIPPIFLAASYGYHEIFEILLNAGAKLTNDRHGCILNTILHASYRGPGHRECLKLALPHCKDCINTPDNREGSTPLHYAVRHRNDFATLEILKNGGNLAAKNYLNETPIEDLKKDVFEEFLNEMAEPHPVPDNMDQEVNYAVKLKFLTLNNSETEILELISKNRELRSLIQHPVLSSFIFFKWNSYQSILYSNFIIFLALISLFVLYIVLTHMGFDYKILYFFSLFAIILLFLRELFQIIFLPSKYVKSVVNIIEIIFIIVATLSLIPNTATNTLRAFAIILSAFEVLHLAGELPFLSISTNMVILVKVVVNYLKSMILYLTIPVAFGLAFFVLHQHIEISPTPTPNEEEEKKNEFDNFGFPVIALIKVMVMWIGEFDASSLDLPKKTIFYWCFFLLFVFLIPIVLFNVLCALAVDDIQQIKAEGELTDLRARIRVLVRYEKIIKSNYFIENWMRKCTGYSEISEILNKDGKIVLSASRRFKVVDEDRAENETCFCSMMRLDVAIGKRLRDVIEMKERDRRHEMERINEEKAKLEELNSSRKDIQKINDEIKMMKELLNKLINK